MRTLLHGQQVRSKSFKFQGVITVGTIQGFYGPDKEDIRKGVSRAKSNPIQPLAWTNQRPSMICADYEGKDKEMEEKALAFQESACLEDGEQVTIEGLVYTVKIGSESTSDPIHFIPSK